MSADEPVSLHRPVLHKRRNLVGIVATAGVCFAAGLGVAIAIDDDAMTIVPVATPLAIQLPAAPPITVVAPPPAPPVPEPAVEAPAPVPVPPPKATAPRLDAQCFYIYSPEEDPPEVNRKSCEWDDGFPAVSRDGKLVVTKVVDEDGGRGNPNLTIRFLDVATSKIVRDIVVLDADEVGAMYDGSGKPTKRAQLERVVARRMAHAQRVIDQRGYRSLEHLGTNDQYHDQVETDPAQVHAEFDGTAVRAIDPATNRVLWSHRFDVPNPSKRDIADDDCAGWGLRELAVAWDPQTRVVIGTSQYDTGGCLCDTVGVEQIVRMP